MNQTAQGLAALGRGPDTQLVHMAPSEVNSLQQLAMAHGGSLTINPETGLPEAGFLSSILPMVLGAGAMMVPGLQGLGAGWIGAGIGGLQALRTGSLKKGLMAGLGAYGGAGLGSALAGAGGANMAAAGGVNAANIAGPAVPPIEAFNPSNVTASMGDKMLAGAQGLGSEAGRNTFMSQIGGGKGLMQAGLAAAAPMLLDTTTKQPEFKQDASMGQRYQFNAGSQTPTPVPDVPEYGDQSRNFGKEQRYFTPSYTPIDDATAKKQYNFASGGPVEAMSDANSIGMNTGYPQADINTGAYATPFQQPISRNVVTGAQDAAVDPYTGQAQFAEGGDVGGYTYDPVTQMYTKKAGEGATMVSPTGGISGASGDSGGNNTLNSKTNDYLTWEETTPAGQEARAARMNQVENLLTLGVPGASVAALLGGRSVQMPDFGVLFGTPQSYQDAVGQQTQAAQQYGNQGLNQMSGRQEAQMNAGSDFGGGGGGGGVSASEAAGPSGEGTESGGDGWARGGLAALAQGGISNLGDYSDGGRLLRGPGDGISDSIPAMIGKKQPARLADGEFVVPARIVSELGNGSTEAGARKLYAMMDRIQKARGKTVGKGKVAANSRSAKYLPA
tara:strand:+ start:9185 stop:11029 length:1845 start_codon:yes stop_codon:yes gene_type:complete